jgi:diacylglycerol kinase family enzyme
MMAGVGLDAHIVYNLDLNLKAAWGKLAYWYAGFGNIGRKLASFDVRVDGRTLRSSFALASRVRNYGGDLEIARNASLLDNEFEMVLFEGENASGYLKYLAGVLLRRAEGMQGVSVLRVRSAEFLAPADSRVYVQVDGEYAGRLPARVEIVDSSLTLLVPPEFRRKMQQGRSAILNVS